MDQFKLMSAALRSIGDGVIITGLDSSIVFINDAVENITGWGQVEVLGKPFDEVFRIIDAQTGIVLESPVWAALDKGIPVGLKNNSMLLTKSGSAIFVSANASPVRDEQGQITGVVLVLRDITRLKHVEDRLCFEEKKLTTIFNSVPIGMLIINNNHEIVQINQFFLNMSGLNEHSDVVGRRPGDVLQCVNSAVGKRGCGFGPECDSCPLRVATISVLESGKAVHGVETQLWLMVDDLEYRPWVRVNIIPLQLQNTRHAVMILQDITKYKAMEENLVKSRDFYLTLFENFPSLIWRAGLDKKCNYFNESWLEFTGRTLEQEIGDGWTEGVHPDDLERYLNTYFNSFRFGQAFEIEYRLRRYDGQYRWVLGIGKPFVDFDGIFAGYIGAGYDITERKLAEEALRHYELLSETANDIILFVEKTGQIIEANSAAIKAYGYTREELLTKTIFDLRAIQQDAERSDIFNSQVKIADTEGVIFETTHYRKDGTSFPVEVSSQATMIGGKRVLLSIIRDITERKKAEYAMRQAVEAANAAYRAKSEFLANMSHEIRTPLNGIIGMIDITQRSQLTREQQENLTIARNCADSLLAIINDILDFSKMEAGKLILENVEFSLQELVEKTVKAHAVSAETKGIELNYQLAANLPAVVIGDPYRLQQVLNNLIGNAVKFTEKGKVDVTVKAQPSQPGVAKLLFVVADTGIGIHPADIDRLFKSFSQIDGSHTRKYGGTGLGLAISKQLVGMMDGTIWVESTKRQGSTFYFTIQFQTSVKQSIVSKAVPALKTRRTLHILLAEDNQQAQVVASLMLKEMGHTFKVANTGVEVLKLLSKEKFDLILMDIQMPDMDGMETTLVIREQEKLTGKHLPIIALTAHALLGDREKFLALGMDDYVAKPVNLTALFEAIERTMASVEDQDISRLIAAVTTPQKSDHSLNQDMWPVIRAIMSQMKQFLAVIADNNLPGVEVVANNIKSLAAKISLDSTKSLAFRVALAARRGNWSEVVALFRELEKDLENLQKLIGKPEK